MSWKHSVTSGAFLKSKEIATWDSYDRTSGLAVYTVEKLDRSDLCDKDKVSVLIKIKDLGQASRFYWPSLNYSHEIVKVFTGCP